MWKKASVIVPWQHAHLAGRTGPAMGRRRYSRSPIARRLMPHGTMCFAGEASS